jgi:hypothetical protein
VAARRDGAAGLARGPFFVKRPLISPPNQAPDSVLDDLEKSPLHRPSPGMTMCGDLAKAGTSRG